MVYLRKYLFLYQAVCLDWLNCHNLCLWPSSFGISSLGNGDGHEPLLSALVASAVRYAWLRLCPTSCPCPCNHRRAVSHKLSIHALRLCNYLFLIRKRRLGLRTLSSAELIFDNGYSHISSIVNRQNALSSFLKVYVAPQHRMFLHVSVRTKGSSSGNTNRTMLHKTQKTSVHTVNMFCIL